MKNDICLITPPSFHVVPGATRIMVLGAPSARDQVLNTFQQLWPDRALSLYHVEGAADEALMHWLVYNVRLMHDVVINISDDTALGLGPFIGWLSERNNVWFNIADGEHGGFTYIARDHARNQIGSCLNETIARLVHTKYQK
jgi:hypothetical protein